MSDVVPQEPGSAPPPRIGPWVLLLVALVMITVGLVVHARRAPAPVHPAGPAVRAGTQPSPQVRRPSVHEARRRAWALFTATTLLLLIWFVSVVAVVLARRFALRYRPADRPTAPPVYVDPWAEAGRRLEPPDHLPEDQTPEQ